MRDKGEIRKKILKIRAELLTEDIKLWSVSICNIIRVMDIYHASDDICLYMPVRNEVDVSYLIENSRKDGKRIWLPAVRGGSMEFYRYEKETLLSEGAYGILEPENGEKLMPKESTLVVMPGAAFSEDHDRIGYGGGYYDYFLHEHPYCKTLAVCYDFQIFPQLPCDEHDIKPDIIVSNERVMIR